MINLTEIQNGKRVVIEDNLFDGSLDTISQIFQECKMTAYDIGRFAIPAKPGKNNITLLIDMEHQHPHFHLCLNDEMKLKWEYIPDFSFNEKKWLFIDPSYYQNPSVNSNGYLLNESEILNNILEKIRYYWNNN